MMLQQNKDSNFKQVKEFLLGLILLSIIIAGYALGMFMSFQNPARGPWQAPNCMNVQVQDVKDHC